MATTWLTRYTNSKQTWLLDNGEVVPEPVLEESNSGIRVRLKGSSESFYRRQTEEVIAKGLHRVAQQKQTCVWMPVDLDEKVLIRTLRFDPDERPRAELKLDSAVGIKATAWWSFRHHSLPIRAVLAIELRRTSITQFTIDARMMYPSTQRNDTRNPVWLMARESDFADWADGLLGVAEYNQKFLERDAIETMLKLVRAAESLDEVTIPDLRDPQEPDVLTLGLDAQNVNHKFIDDMKEYLEGAPAIEVAADLYAQLVVALRGIGLVLPESLKDNQFYEALANHSKGALTVRVKAADLPDDGEDRTHVVSVHLPSGTFVVTCQAKQNKDAIAHAWEESKLLASLTGQEDELLAYARRYVETEHEREAKKIIKQRKNSN